MRLRINRLCCKCGKPANMADHMKPKRYGGSDALANLRSMC
jgi:5-methylcytosine-specific restriction endonuclease McrA